MNNPDKRKYDFDTNSAPIAWLNYSEELKEIAELAIKYSGYSINRYPNMSSSFSLERGFFLNYGFSIETLLKGLLIAENPNFVSEGKISEKISNRHNLINLSEQVQSISFEEKEIKLFEILTDAIPYWGRYPIPKKYTQVCGKTPFSESLHNQLENLWFKIGRCLYEKIKFGWEGPSGIKTGPYISSIFESEEEFESSMKQLNEMKERGKIEFGNIETEKLPTTKAKFHGR